ncbi:MAG: tripartite tricarboxylate transporter TctB family protein [Desulfobacterales bacterium]|nr:MAG: tripartite tricarboxylate transporter TctB family protein [Desulfobacterales bacterium]
MELIMAFVMGAFSVYQAIKSTELPIGWIPEEGPGGGAFPFWLSVGMIICCIAIIVRWFRGTSPLSQSTDEYMSRAALKQFAIGAGSLTVTIFLFHIIGVYAALPLYLFFIMRIAGKHGWFQIGMISLTVVVVTFLFFEIALNITLPKGVTEPLFYPLYDFFLG